MSAYPVHYESVDLMVSQEIEAYYDATAQRNIRADLHYAVSLVSKKKVAIDCGCGAGADIAYILDNGFEVHAFDVEQESISRCQERFKNDEKLSLFKDSFESFEYPKASFLVADASLFFCAKQSFDGVWHNIEKALVSGGVFCGSFLGSEDTMATPEFDASVWWPNVLVLTQDQVRNKLNAFQIKRFTEHRKSGVTPQGELHEWHIFSVVAIKI